MTTIPYSFLLGRLPFIFILLFLNSLTCLGENASKKESNEHIHGSHFECPLPKSRSDIISCALAYHPRVRRAKLDVDTASVLIKKASQTPNPVLSSRYVEDNSSSVSELETNLGFVLELGEKRHSRKKLANSKVEFAKISLEEIQAKVKLQTVLHLFRLRQIINEKQIMKKSVGAFSKVIKQLKNLPRLSAEQEVSLTLFEIAHEEIQVTRAALFEEERKVAHYFHIATGHALEELQNFLLTPPKKWPILKLPKKHARSANVKRLESLALVADMQLQVQESKKWPDVTIGPSFAIEKEGAHESNMYGFNIQLPLPLFQRNEGARAYASRQLTSAQQHVRLTKSEEQHERLEQVQVYESSVKILAQTMTPEEITAKHSRVEELYLRGVVSSSMFLESLKQKLAYLVSRNQREMSAMNALWSIYLYDGRILKEAL